MKKLLTFLFAALFSVAACGQEHLDLARKMVDEIKAENNKYTQRNIISYSLDGQLQVSANCVGFVNYTFDKTEAQGFKALKGGTKWKINPRADAYYTAISNEIGFTRLYNVKDIKPGDIIAYQIVETIGKDAPEYGHVMIADTTAEHVLARAPRIDNTKQWLVQVLDSAPGAHGPSDTRYTRSGPAKTGIGRGPFRIYTDDEGKPVGFSWSDRSLIYRPNEEIALVIGRVK